MQNVYKNSSILADKKIRYTSQGEPTDQRAF